MERPTAVPLIVIADARIKLDMFGIDLSRHGYLWELPSAMAVDTPTFEAIEEWFLTGVKAANGLKPLPEPPHPGETASDDDDYGWDEGPEDQSLYEWLYGADA